MASAQLNAIGLKWVPELANYKFSRKYNTGKKDADADYLSYNPVQGYITIVWNLIIK